MKIRNGFTLIELSLVLVIIGLLADGILAGRDLIKAAEIRSVISDTDKYKTAYNTFKGKYNCIPGDCINATDFFGAQTTPDAACAALTTPSTETLTCDGDGDGQVDDWGYEMFRFWQHLAIAGLIKGKYTGVTGSGAAGHHVLGTNAPIAAITGTGFSFSYVNMPNSTYSSIYSMNYGHVFWFGKANSNNRTYTDVFTPAEAFAFDQKIDDGKPATGLVIYIGSNYAWGHPNSCTTSTNYLDFTGSYRTTSSAVACAFLIKTGI